MEDKKLKPCPFCGAKAEIKESGHGHDVIAAYVLCEGCGATGKEFTYGYMSGRHQEAHDAAAEAWNKRAKKAEDAQEIQRTNGAFKINPYREYPFSPELQKWLQGAEEALGYKLFFWQKTYIERGVFRYFGCTTAQILRELAQINEPPLNLVRYRARGDKERWYCEELLGIKEKLDAAGVPTRDVILSDREYKEWFLGQKEKPIRQVSARQDAYPGLRPLGKFWDV